MKDALVRYNLLLMTKLYTMNTSLVCKTDIEFLSAERRRKAERFIFERDRKLSIAASMLISRGLREYGVREAHVVYAYGKHGKPYLRDYPSVHFNVSHSGNLAVAVFSDREVGCDVEILRPYDESVATMCFTPRERESIESSEDSSFAFTRLWCVKESFLKALGLGLDGRMDSFSVMINDDEISIGQDFDRKKWKVTTLMMDNHFIAVSEENI